ncbi:MAG: hypothetical protein ACLUE8_09795 [Lachnospiraceae bacterium]
MDYVLEQGNFGFKQMDVEGKVIRLFGRHNGLVEWCRLLQLSGMNHWGAGSATIPFSNALRLDLWYRPLSASGARPENAIELVREEKEGDQREKNVRA